MIDENNKTDDETHSADLNEAHTEEVEISTPPGWREIFRQAFDKARREQQPTSRRELGRDRSRSLFLLAGAAIAVLLLFLGVFSSSNPKKTAGARPLATPDLGRRVTAGQERGSQLGSLTPLLNAETSSSQIAPEQDVTPDEIGRTARPAQSIIQPTSAPVSSPSNAGPYALGRINFSETAQREQKPLLSKATGEPTSDDLRKLSLVFVRSTQTNAPVSGVTQVPTPAHASLTTLNLPAGTRLMARLQATVSSAVKTPVVAAIEYNYERDQGIVVPAGAQVIGTLQQADRSGYVAIRFDTIQMPGGSTEKIDAAAMSLNLGPVKGFVSGKRTGTNFLIRAFTGIGQAASYLVASKGLNAPLSEGALVRDQIATNLGIAGDQQLNSLASNQNLVVSVPGNTRFYVVMEKDATSAAERAWPKTVQQAAGRPLDAVQELQQLMQLERELSALYQQPSRQSTAQQLQAQ